MADHWERTAVAELRVGHFVRIGDRWLEHPFLRRSFLIATARDLALLRAAGVRNVCIDRSRSHAGPDATTPTSPEPELDVAADAARLHSEKAAYASAVQQRRQGLLHTRRNYESAAARAEEALGLLAAGDGQASGAIETLAREALASSNDGLNPLSFAGAAPVKTAQRRLACESLDAMALALAIGRRFALPREELELLAATSLVHGVGLAQLAPGLREEQALLSGPLPLEFQDYPLLGVQMLRECGGFVPEVLQIVRQHRERPDGSGFPEGADASQIHRLALIVGVVREFLVLTATRAGGMPAAALSHLYRNLRGVYGGELIDNLVAAVTVYPPGSFLSLSDGSVGRVVRVSEQARLKPMVCLYDDGPTCAEGEIVDLAETGDLSIARVLAPAQLEQDVRRFFGECWAGYALSAAEA